MLAIGAERVAADQLALHQALDQHRPVRRHAQAVIAGGACNDLRVGAQGLKFAGLAQGKDVLRAETVGGLDHQWQADVLGSGDQFPRAAHQGEGRLFDAGSGEAAAHGGFVAAQSGGFGVQMAQAQREGDMRRLGYAQVLQAQHRVIGIGLMRRL